MHYSTLQIECFMDCVLSYLSRLRDVTETDQFSHLGIEDHFYKEFPESITLDQTVAVWKHIVVFKEFKQD